MAIGMRRLAAVLAAILFAALPATSGERVLARPHMATDDSREAGHVARQGRRGRGRGRLLSSTAVLLAATGAARTRAQEFVQTVAELLENLDTNGDGKVDKEEYRAKASMESDVDDRMQKQILAFLDQLFDAADIDGDGFLSERELEFADLARDVASQAEDSTEEVPRFQFGRDTAQTSLNTFDADADGEIGKEEYLDGMRSFASDWEWLSSFDHPGLVKWMDDTWSKVDVTGDGKLNVEEVNFLMALVNRDAWSGMFSPHAFAGQVLQDLDADGDGKVSAAELAKVAEDLAAKGPEQTGTAREATEGEATEGEATEPAEAGAGAPGEGEPEAARVTFTSSSEVVARMQELFHEVDADKDGSLNIEELTELTWRFLGEL